MTLAVKHVAPKVGFVDKPGHRKIHSNPKPLGGGIAIFWAFALPILAALSVVRIAPSPEITMIGFHSPEERVRLEEDARRLREIAALERGVRQEEIPGLDLRTNRARSGFFATLRIHRHETRDLMLQRCDDRTAVGFILD